MPDALKNRRAVEHCVLAPSEMLNGSLLLRELLKTLSWVKCSGLCTSAHQSTSLPGDTYQVAPLKFLGVVTLPTEWCGARAV